MMGCTIIGCSVRFYQPSPDTSQIARNSLAIDEVLYLHLLKGQKISNWKLLSLNTTKILKAERARGWNKWQLHITMNLSVLEVGRLSRVRTWNNVFLKPRSILCNVLGTKSSYVFRGELGTQCCQLYLQCVLSLLPDQDFFSKCIWLPHSKYTSNNGIWWEER